MKIAAAHWRIIQEELRGSIGAPRWFVVRGQKRSFILRAMPEGYSVVVLLRKRAGFQPCLRAFAVAEFELAKEAAWEMHARLQPWHVVAVVCDRKGRPRWISTSSESPDVGLAVI